MYSEYRTPLQILRWSANITNTAMNMSVGVQCFSVFIDINSTLYCSADVNHVVIKTPLNSGSYNITTAAGNWSSGTNRQQLYVPNGIFVNLELDLYIADCYNNRIIRFQPDALNGTVVAGNGAVNTITLSKPTAIWLDGDDNLYIIDYSNHRIVASSTFGFRCVVGCSGMNGSAANQLNGPRALAFDSFGNILITDTDNYRLQKFTLKSNYCGKFNRFWRTTWAGSYFKACHK